MAFKKGEQLTIQSVIQKSEKNVLGRKNEKLLYPGVDGISRQKTRRHGITVR